MCRVQLCNSGVQQSWFFGRNSFRRAPKSGFWMDAWGGHWLQSQARGIFFYYCKTWNGKNIRINYNFFAICKYSIYIFFFDLDTLHQCLLLSFFQFICNWFSKNRAWKINLYELCFCLFWTWILQATPAVKVKFEKDKKLKFIHIDFLNLI